MTGRVEIGDMVGAYRITRELGRGGMGVVLLGEQLATGRVAALKLLPPELVDDADSRRRFAREANVLFSPGADGVDHCYLTDFGLGKSSSQDSVALTDTGSYVGTFHYTAPEIVVGRAVDHRVDM